MDTPSGYSTPGDVRQRRSLWQRLKIRNENLHELTEDGSDFTLIRGSAVSWANWQTSQIEHNESGLPPIDGVIGRELVDS